MAAPEMHACNLYHDLIVNVSVGVSSQKQSNMYILLHVDVLVVLGSSEGYQKHHNDSRQWLLVKSWLKRFL